MFTHLDHVPSFYLFHSAHAVPVLAVHLHLDLSRVRAHVLPQTLVEEASNRNIHLHVVQAFKDPNGEYIVRDEPHYQFIARERTRTDLFENLLKLKASRS